MLEINIELGTLVREDLKVAICPSSPLYPGALLMVPSFRAPQRISVLHLRGSHQLLPYISPLASGPILAASSDLMRPVLMISWVVGNLLLSRADSRLMQRT